MPMRVRYQTSAARGFELSSRDVRVVAAPYEEAAREDAGEAEARLRIRDELQVGYDGFCDCTR